MYSNHLGMPIWANSGWIQLINANQSLLETDPSMNHHKSQDDPIYKLDHTGMLIIWLSPWHTKFIGTQIDVEFLFLAANTACPKERSRVAPVCAACAWDGHVPNGRSRTCRGEETQSLLKWCRGRTFHKKTWYCKSLNWFSFNVWKGKITCGYTVHKRY